MTGALLWRRALFILVNLAIAGAIWAVVIAPIDDALVQTRQEVAQKAEMFARLESVARSGDAVQAFAASVRDLASQGDFLEGQSDGAIDANLQARLKGLAEAAGAQARSLRALAPKPIEDGALVGARLEATGTLKAMQATIVAAEAETPLLIVFGAIMRPAQTGRLVENEEPRMEAQFDIYGAARPREGK